jgi:hypothetical protein
LAYARLAELDALDSRCGKGRGSWMAVDWSAQGFFNRPAIRGREQQLIDFYGGVGCPGVANAIRAVRPDHPFGRPYHAASDALFGPLAPYTGY